MAIALNDKLFVPKDIVCPICSKEFKRYVLRKNQFSLDKRDMDYRPVYLGNLNPRFFSVSVCPNCYYAAEDKYFCPLMTEEESRRKALLDNHKSQWEAQNRVRAATSGQQIWKDLEAEKLRELTPTNLAILRQIKPLLEKVAGSLKEKGKPFNELQKDGDLEAAIKSWELAAICAKARKANHRLLGYTYLNAAWTARDAFELAPNDELKRRYKEFERAYLSEAISFLTITNAATSVDDAFMPDGTRIPKENIPQTRVFEIMYILAGANRLLGRIEDSNKFLEQLIFGGQGAQGPILWFVKQAREMRHETTSSIPNMPLPQDEDDESDEEI